MICKFKLGEKVDCGIIIGIEHPMKTIYNAVQHYQMEALEIENMYNEAWTKQWLQAPIYTIALKEPTRQLSYEQFLFHSKLAILLENEPAENYKQIYEDNVLLQSVMNIPEHLVKAQIIGDGGFDFEKIEENKNVEEKRN